MTSSAATAPASVSERTAALENRLEGMRARLAGRPQLEEGDQIANAGWRRALRKAKATMMADKMAEKRQEQERAEHPKRVIAERAFDALKWDWDNETIVSDVITDDEGVESLAWDLLLRSNIGMVEGVRRWTREMYDALRPGGKGRGEGKPKPKPKVRHRNPCLQCAGPDGRTGNLPCSFEFAGGSGSSRGRAASSCARCARNGVPFCIQLWSMEVEEESQDDPAGRACGGREDLRPPAKASVPADDLPRGWADGGTATTPMTTTATVCCGDGAATAEDLVGAVETAAVHGPARSVLGGDPAAGSDRRGWALPMWHANDRPENRRDLEYAPRTASAYFQDRAVAEMALATAVVNGLRLRLRRAGGGYDDDDDDDGYDHE